MEDDLRKFKPLQLVPPLVRLAWSLYIIPQIILTPGLWVAAGMAFDAEGSQHNVLL